jgi:predicted transcriptional regulator
VGEEMKAWAKTVESNLKGEHKLSDKEMHEHHARLYKWLLFLEDLFHSYEGTLRTQTSLHALG